MHSITYMQITYEAYITLLAELYAVSTIWKWSSELYEHFMMRMVLVVDLVLHCPSPNDPLQQHHGLFCLFQPSQGTLHRRRWGAGHRLLNTLQKPQRFGRLLS